MRIYTGLKVSGKNIIKCILYIVLFMNIAIDLFHVPNSVKYVNDVLVLILLIGLIQHTANLKVFRQVKYRNVLFAMFVYILINFITDIINLVDFPLIVWASRNTYRFFVFFVACIIYLEKKDIVNFLDSLYGIQIVNIILIIYQFAFLGLRQDTLGGIFGFGGNAGLLIYSVLLLSYSMTQYIYKACSLPKFLFVFLSTSIGSVLAEIRIFFVFVIIIYLVNLCLNYKINKLSLRKIGIAVVAVILAVVALQIYSVLFPYVSFSIQDLIKEGSSTGGGYNISRLGAFKDIDSIFYHGSILKNLFGLGFGNCEFSSFDFFTSSFYLIYGSYNYRWFTHQWIFLESGYFGIISFFVIFVVMLIYTFKLQKKLICNQDKILNIVCLIMIITSMISIIYNSLLKADFGYLAYWSMCISAVLVKHQSNTTNERLDKKKNS